jgi:SpoVK/Ycf46/Vps4 family AAA+-type ATPase
MKRHQDAPQGRYHKIFEGLDFTKLSALKVERDDTTASTQDTNTALPEKLEQLAAALCAANPDLTRQQALFFLIHNAHGRALAERLSSVLKSTREDQMHDLKSIAKQSGGLSVITSHIIEKGETSFSEHDFTAAVMEAAKLTKRDGETDAKVFSRLFESSADIRKAYSICRGY